MSLLELPLSLYAAHMNSKHTGQTPFRPVAQVKEGNRETHTNGSLCYVLLIQKAKKWEKEEDRKIKNSLDAGHLKRRELFVGS